MEPDQIQIIDKLPENHNGDALIRPIPGDRLSESESLEDFYRTAGQEVLSTVTKKLPLRPGNVSVTSGGTLNYDRIVHIPVQSAPGVPTTEENLQVGLRSGLVAADEEGTRTVVLADVIPADQREEMDYDSVAETLIEDLLQYPPAHFVELNVVSRDQNWLEALRRILESG